MKSFSWDYKKLGELRPFISWLQLAFYYAQKINRRLGTSPLPITEASAIIKEEIIMASQEKKQELERYEALILDKTKKNKYNNRKGLYYISINNKIVYIGKSTNILCRLANHLYEIDNNNKTKKYIMLRALRQAGYTIKFDVLQYMDNATDTEISIAEAIEIRKHLPVLNLQLPALDGSQHWETHKRAKKLTYSLLIEYLGEPEKERLQ